MTTSLPRPLVVPEAPTSPFVPPTRVPAPPPPAPPRGTPARVMALRRVALSITAFTVLGHVFLGFEQSPLTPIVTLLVSYTVALVLEWLDSHATGRDPEYRGGVGALVTFLLPAHIAALACAMLLWGNSSLWPYAFAVAVANTGKYLLRLRVGGRMRHVFNPSNLGIATALVLFPWVGIAPPYHFTTNVTGALDWLLPLFVLGAGTMLNATLTNRMPLILAWVGAFVGQAILRWLLLDHALVAALLPMTGFAFVLFTNYMITDPGTTPFGRRGQVAFGVTTAAVYGLLVVSGVTFGLFFALVITCGLRAIGLLVQARRPTRPRPADRPTSRARS